MTAVDDLADLIESQGLPFLHWADWYPGGNPASRWTWNNRTTTRPIIQKLPATRHWVHHSVTSSLVSAPVAARQINDIGISRFGRMSYPFLIHSTGAIIQGVFPYVGAHTRNYNSTSLAGCNIGNFDDVVPSSKMVNANGVLIRSLRKLGILINVPGIDLHRNAKGASTACPGRFMASQLGAIANLGMTDVLPPIPTPVPPEESNVRDHIIFFAADPGTDNSNHAYRVNGLFGHYLDEDSLAAALYLGTPKANEPSRPFPPNTRGAYRLLDGPLANI